MSDDDGYATHAKLENGMVIDIRGDKSDQVRHVCENSHFAGCSESVNQGWRMAVDGGTAAGSHCNSQYEEQDDVQHCIQYARVGFELGMLNASEVEVGGGGKQMSKQNVTSGKQMKHNVTSQNVLPHKQELLGDEITPVFGDKMEPALFGDTTALIGREPLAMGATNIALALSGGAGTGKNVKEGTAKIHRR